MPTDTDASRRPDGRAFGGAARPPMLALDRLDVYYGRAHALQGVSLALDHGVLAVVGRNGMGKTTLCNAITGLLPDGSSARGGIRLEGAPILGLAPHVITERGIGYVPQGRRVWPSLTVDEHLKLASRSARRGEWTIERVYGVFPRLADRRHHGGAQLSGGEQQMLAIGRALLFNPKLLVMDEPTEGLAPVIVDQVAAMLKSLAEDGAVAVLLIEQNLGVAIDVADTVAVLVNGRIARVLPAAELDADVELQQRLLGVKAAAGDAAYADDAAEDGDDDATTAQPPPRVLTVRRAGDAGALPRLELPRTVRGITAWNHADAAASPYADRPLGAPPPAPDGGTADGVAAPVRAVDRAAAPAATARVFEHPVAATLDRAAYVAGTFDTKARELGYLRDCIQRLGIRTVTVDLSTSGRTSTATVHPREVARHHPGGEQAVFSGDRGSSVVAMAQAFERFILTRRDVGGLISAGGSGGTSLATAAMRALPVGVPKLMVSSVASGDTRPYVGPSDICMMYSVTDVQGINRISEQVLANAAHALAGMIAHAPRPQAVAAARPAIGLTMFGVTTPCVQQVVALLDERFDCLVFHATGTGGQSMEKLADSALLAGVIDVSTTEIADEIGGGVFSAGPGRLDAIARSGVPYVGSCGALDMVNFHAMDTVPERFRQRRLYRHNANVTLMRTTAEENAAIGAFIAGKLNRMQGPVRFVLPEGGVSMIDAPGQPFWDPAADAALFDAIERGFTPGPKRRLLRSKLHINDPAFAELLVRSFLDIVGPSARGGANGRSGPE